MQVQSASAGRPAHGCIVARACKIVLFPIGAAMTSSHAKHAVMLFAFLAALSWAVPARAQIEIGTWVQQSGTMPGMTMTVETCCGSTGRRLTYRMGGAV